MQAHAQIFASTNNTQIFRHKLRVLVVEDETLFARAVIKRLKNAGYDCEHADTIENGRAVAKQFLPDIVLLDMRLPDGNGLDLLSEFVSRGLAVIVMTAFGELSDAVNAMKQGATDYLKKPVDLEELLLAIGKAENAAKLKSQIGFSRQRNTHDAVLVNNDFIGESAVMQQVRRQIERIAQLTAIESAIPPTVLINGETGTGKDVAARMLHACMNKDRPFVHVDCASLPAELIESELFGHERGAFTSAQASRSGLIEAAEDGTLFLDEIGELPLSLQAKLLNVLERRMVRRVGSTKERPVAARFVAATNRDLQQMVLDGRFRSDLFYRLNVLNIVMPALRDRGEDILMLARYFAAQTERRYDLPSRPFSEEAIEIIQNYIWPGNVRELKHQINRAVLLSRGDLISGHDLAISIEPGISTVRSQANADNLTLDEAEKALIEKALSQANNNVSEAARLLGITRMAIRYRMDKHGITGD